MDPNAQNEGQPEKTASEIWKELEQEEAGVAAADKAKETAQDEHDAGNAAADTTSEAAATAAAESAAAEPDERTLLLDQVNGLKQMVGDLTERLRRNEGHIGGLNNAIERLRVSAKASGVDTPSSKQIEQAAGDEDAMKDLKERYPDFGAAMERAVAPFQKAIAELRGQVGQAPRPEGVVTREELEARDREIAVEFKHPGWKDTVKTPEFSGWLQRQPREVQILAQSADAQDAIRLLDLHKEARQAKPAVDKTKRLEAAARLPSGRGGGSIRTKPVEEMTPQEYWAYLNEKERAEAARS